MKNRRNLIILAVGLIPLLILISLLAAAGKRREAEWSAMQKRQAIFTMLKVRMSAQSGELVSFLLDAETIALRSKLNASLVETGNLEVEYAQAKKSGKGSLALDRIALNYSKRIDEAREVTGPLLKKFEPHCTRIDYVLKTLAATQHILSDAEVKELAKLAGELSDLISPQLVMLKDSVALVNAFRLAIAPAEESAIPSDDNDRIRDAVVVLEGRRISNLFERNFLWNQSLCLCIQSL